MTHAINASAAETSQSHFETDFQALSPAQILSHSRSDISSLSPTDQFIFAQMLLSGASDHDDQVGFEILESLPKEQFCTNYEIGIFSLQKGRYGQAIRAIRELLKDEPCKTGPYCCDAAKLKDAQGLLYFAEERGKNEPEINHEITAQLLPDELVAGRLVSRFGSKKNTFLVEWDFSQDFHLWNTRCQRQLGMKVFTDGKFHGLAFAKFPTKGSAAKKKYAPFSGASFSGFATDFGPDSKICGKLSPQNMGHDHAFRVDTANSRIVLSPISSSVKSANVCPIYILHNAMFGKVSISGMDDRLFKLSAQNKPSFNASAFPDGLAKDAHMKWCGAEWTGQSVTPASFPKQDHWTNNGSIGWDALPSKNVTLDFKNNTVNF